MPKAVIVIPCYNEEARLDRAELLRLARADGDLSLLFVDDGSRDRTADAIRALARDAPAMELLQLPANVGKAEAVRAGLRRALAAGADVVGYVDADLATPVDEVLRVLRVAAEGSHQVVLASRVRLLGTAIDRRAARHYLGRVFATLASLALRLPVYDTQCGAKFFARTAALTSALEEPFRSRWAFDVELLERLTRGGPVASRLSSSSMIEIPLRRWSDVGGSKLRLRAMIRAAADVLLILVRGLRPPRADR